MNLSRQASTPVLSSSSDDDDRSDGSKWSEDKSVWLAAMSILNQVTVYSVEGCQMILQVRTALCLSNVMPHAASYKLHPCLEDRYLDIMSLTSLLGHIVAVLHPACFSCRLTGKIAAAYNLCICAQVGCFGSGCESCAGSCVVPADAMLQQQLLGAPAVCSHGSAHSC